MRIPRIYTGSDGQSHWDEIEIDLTFRPGEEGWVSSLQRVSGVTFRRASSNASIDWHPAPSRQYVVTLSGSVEYEIGDGTRRLFGPGSIFLADDQTGQGHISRGVGSEERISMYLRLDEMG